MAALSLHNLNHFSSILFPSSPSPSPSSSLNSGFALSSGGSLKRGKFLVLLSTHSNPKILKSNKKSRYGQTINPYDTEEDEEGEEDEEFDEDDDMAGDDWLMNVSFLYSHFFLLICLIAEDYMFG